MSTAAPRTSHALQSTIAAVGYAFAWFATSRNVADEVFAAVRAATWEAILAARGWTPGNVIATPEGPLAYWRNPKGVTIRVRREAPVDARTAYDQLVAPLALDLRQSPGEVVATALAVQHLTPAYSMAEALALVGEFMSKVNRAQMVAMFTSAPPPPEERAAAPREDRPDGVGETLAPEKVTPKTVTAKRVAIGEPEWAPKMREWFEAYPNIVEVAVVLARQIIGEKKAAGEKLTARSISARDIGRRIKSSVQLRCIARGALGAETGDEPGFALYYSTELGVRMRAADPMLAQYMASSAEA
jgi:hypothetical protein